MQTKELNDRSPMRVLENSLHGGLGQGKLGVVVARKGVGKTAFLVGVALDDLMRGRNVLHIGLDQTVTNIIEHYDEVYSELAHDNSLEDVWRVRLDVERHRQVHAFLDGSFSVEKARETIQNLRSYAEFSPSTIIVEGLAFEQLSGDDLEGLRAIAKGCDAELWMSATTTRDTDKDDTGVPAHVAAHRDRLDVILSMAHDGNNVHVGVLKDHDSTEVPASKVALDPTTMLLIKE